MKKMETPQITNANLASCAVTIIAGLIAAGLETGTAIICEAAMMIEIYGLGGYEAI